MTTSQPKLHLSMIGATVALFVLALAIDELLFTRLEFAPGINWIYLPACVRLLCTLLFAEAGAIGPMLASWSVAHLGMRKLVGLQAALTNLTPARLLLCALAFSLASSLPHHLWFAL